VLDTLVRQGRKWLVSETTNQTHDERRKLLRSQRTNAVPAAHATLSTLSPKGTQAHELGRGTRKKGLEAVLPKRLQGAQEGQDRGGVLPQERTKEPLTRTDEITRKARATVRSRLAGEGGEKTMDDIVSLQRINDELMRERDQLRATIEQQQRTLEIANITLETTRRSLKEAEARDRATRREMSQIVTKQGRFHMTNTY
jgi:chromosome segregation ATPase